MEMENHKKHSLGRRAFFFFLSQRIKLVIFLGLLTWALWYGSKWVPPAYLPFWQDYVVLVFFMTTIAYFLLVLFRTYVEYRYYTYLFTEEAFIMTSGYIMRSEIAALYHQIQNVNINRGPMDRLAGVSQVVIFMTGSERDGMHNKIVLPAVGRTKAKLVQKELLMRARKHVSSNPA